MYNNNMKVLFLDIDGVVNSRSTTDFRNNLWPVDPYMAFLIGKIQLDTDCKVVLSSSWRYHPDGVEAAKKIVDILDVTPKTNGRRGDEVQAWLDAHPEVETYAIVDDDSDFHEDQHLFKTTFETGITPEIATAITNHLNGVNND